MCFKVAATAAALAFAALAGCAIREGDSALAGLDSTMTASISGDSAGSIAAAIAPDSSSVLARLENMRGSSGDWSNMATGTSGTISAVEQTAQRGKICRSFQTTRQSYDGIGLYQGKACKYKTDPWRLVYLTAKSPL